RLQNILENLNNDSCNPAPKGRTSPDLEVSPLLSKSGLVLLFDKIFLLCNPNIFAVSRADPGRNPRVVISYCSRYHTTVVIAPTLLLSSKLSCENFCTLV